MSQVDGRARVFTGTERFEVIGAIGAGGMGVVYEALDRERSGRVALKRLGVAGADARVRFTREFRALQDLEHPNLVSLGELFEQDGELFFTMELIDGVDFLRHVRPLEEGPPRRSRPPRIGGGFDEGRLRDALGQLARGLGALHDAGLVHRDIKPSNILVTAEGRLILLDFGLVSDVGPDELPERMLVGTARYMAPEQAARSAVGPEADWYSVGVLLHVALTGLHPFQGTPAEIRALKQRLAPRRPSALAPGVPADLDALCAELLAIHPASRPTGRDVLRRLDLLEEADDRSRIGRVTRFVGRLPELTVFDGAITEALAERPVMLLITGASGVGKSALMRRGLLTAQARGALVLSGRCYERESVTYKGVDDLVGALARHLARLPEAEVANLLPVDVELLGLVFPALHAVAAVAAASRPRWGAIDPQTQRRRLFAAMRELLSRLARGRPLVLAVDDLQWADPDSLALLAEVLAPPNAVSLFVATARAGADRAALGELLAPDDPGALRELPLDVLSEDDASELSQALLGGVGEASLDVRAVALEAGGHPFFIEELVRYRLAQGGGARAVHLDEALWMRIERLPPGGRRFIEILAVAGGPVPVRTMARAVGLDPGELIRLLVQLRHAHLARTTGDGAEDRVEPFHDRVRELVVAHLGAGVLAAHARALALALEASGAVDLEALAVHWHAAGDRARAAGYAARAAERVEAALAFDRAARLYRVALAGTDDPDARHALQIRLGDALANAGRGAEAAAIYEAAADALPEPAALSLRRRAAEGYAQSGHIPETLAALRGVLRAVGMELPRTDAEAVFSIFLGRLALWRRGLGFDERAAADLAPAVLHAVDVCWSTTVSLVFVDTLCSADFQARHLRLALEAGEPFRVARALALETTFQAMSGPRGARRSASIRHVAEALAERLDEPYLRGLVAAQGGLAAFFLGDFRASLTLCDRGLLLYEEGAGAYRERGNAGLFAMWSLWFLGELGELGRRMPLYLRAADERGDRHFGMNLRSGFTNTFWLARDDLDAARAEADRAYRHWSGTAQPRDAYDAMAQIRIALYAGDARAALGHLRRSRLQQTWMARIQILRVTSTHLRAQTLLAAAPQGGRALLDEATGEARRLQAERLPWGDALAALILAGVAAQRRETDEAAWRLTVAARGLDGAGLSLFAAAARLRHGELVGGDEGRAMAADARAWMAGQGIVDPRRMLEVLAPGF